MTKKKDELKNVAASVRDRLKKIADKSGEDFNGLLIRYAIERLLFRLSKSKHKKRFVLKGAMLFALWKETPHRVTRDLDLLGFGESSTEELQKVFGEICSQAVPDDGVIFDPASVKAEPIRAQELYVGVRVDVQGKIGNARTPIQIDVGFGDATAVDPVDVDFPTLLDMPAPKVRAYRMESALAEKYEAAVTLGTSTPKLLWRHVLPNTLPPLIVQISLALSWSLLTEAGLSFLGLGVQPPAPSWGVMLSESRGIAEIAPHLMVFPAIAIMLGVLGFNLLGDGLRDVLDPRQRGRMG